MLKLEVRPEPSRAMSIASPLIALAITVVIGTFLFLLLGKDPLRGLAVFFVEPVKSVYALTELAVELAQKAAGFRRSLPVSLVTSLADLVRAMKPGIESVLKQPGDDLYQRAVVANVRANVQRLQEAKPILADMVAAGKLRVVGAVYDLPTGKVSLV